MLKRGLKRKFPTEFSDPSVQVSNGKICNVRHSGLSFDTNLRFFPQNSKLWEIFTSFKHISTYCRMTINVACQTSRLQRASVRVCGSATLSLSNQPTITTTAYLDKAGKNAASQVGVNAQLCRDYPNIQSNIVFNA